MEMIAMKTFGITCTTILSLLLGIASTAYAQEQQEEPKDKPAQQEEKHTQPEEKKAQPPKPAKENQKTAQQEEKNAKPEAKAAQQEEKNKPEERTAQQPRPPTEQARPGQPAQHAGGNGGGRIPDDRYRANFGREHTFRVTEVDYSRDRRFQYGGYWFGFAAAWPSNWLYTQDVFVVEINGVYYLCNPMYPGVNIALNLEL
jgi:hypothetical protein